MSLKEDVLKLKKEKNAIILAHYYVDGAVQDVADFVGDSYALAKKAKNTDADIIVFAGVKFMGESAKMLNPEKKVLMPDLNADCPMAHMASKAVIKKMKEEYEDLAVVCYINSTVELKTMADICVTSSNAVKIVRSLPNKNIFFIPDGNLGAYVKKQVPEKNIILNDGYCITHKRVTLKDVEKAREESKVPIIFISSATDNMSIVMAISKGADDFVCKPFDLNVLAAKITAILRRSYDFVSNHNILEYQGVRFNLDDNTVSFQSSQMELSKNEAKILRLLMEKKGTIVSRDSLMEYLWKTDFYVDENALSVNVNRLRKKLESIGIVDFIQTKKGLGYKI